MSKTNKSVPDSRSARERIREFATRTPLVRLNVDDAAGEIYLKLENLQPIGSFKLRGAANAMALATDDELADGVYTASAGNMAQGVAYVARQRGIECSVVVPDSAPRTKLAAIERLGARTVMVPYDEWWQVILDHHYPGLKGKFIHPVSDIEVIAGNGTIGLEILDDLPDVDTIIVPYGGGGLISGIASAVKTLRPATQIYAAEVETAAPLIAALDAGSPQTITHTPSFVDGIGGKCVLPEMWPRVRSLVDGSLVVSLGQICDAIRLLVERNSVVAEGAGAASVAAALDRKSNAGRTVCIVSGGNIDVNKLAEILAGTDLINR